MADLLENAKRIQDRILLQRRNRMIGAVAVANALKIWFERDPEQCLHAARSQNLIVKGTVSSGADGETITVDDIVCSLVKMAPACGGKPQDRCFLFAPRRKSREPYWVLGSYKDPRSRYLITTNRRKLENKIDFINKSGRDPQCAIFGMSIREG